VVVEVLIQLVALEALVVVDRELLHLLETLEP
jgi:hypothetical protein